MKRHYDEDTLHRKSNKTDFPTQDILLETSYFFSYTLQILFISYFI